MVGVPTDDDDERFDPDVLAVIMGTDGNNFVLEGGFSEDALRDFVRGFLDGSLKPYLKSAKPPKQQSAVLTVVGSTFDKIVHDPEVDVLIEFYAPWCGHCKVCAETCVWTA